MWVLNVIEKHIGISNVALIRRWHVIYNARSILFARECQEDRVIFIVTSDLECPSTSAIFGKRIFYRRLPNDFNSDKPAPGVSCHIYSRESTSACLSQCSGVPYKVTGDRYWRITCQCCACDCNNRSGSTITRWSSWIAQRTSRQQSRRNVEWYIDW